MNILFHKIYLSLTKNTLEIAYIRYRKGVYYIFCFRLIPLGLCIMNKVLINFYKKNK